MKTKIWILLISLVLAFCIGLSLWLYRPGQTASAAEIWSEGKLLHTVGLNTDQTLTVTSSYGTNVITVKDGAIAVTEADCPDKYCIHRGFCSSDMQIVCLPNRLVIKFTGNQSLDGVVG